MVLSRSLPSWVGRRYASCRHSSLALVSDPSMCSRTRDVTSNGQLQSPGLPVSSRFWHWSGSSVDSRVSSWPGTMSQYTTASAVSAPFLDTEHVSAHVVGMQSAAHLPDR